MNNAQACVIGTLTLVITLTSLPLVLRHAEPRDAVAAQPTYPISRPSDAAASCNALVAEIEQISTEAELRSAAQAHAAKPLAATRRQARLARLLKQRSCVPSSSGAGWATRLPLDFKPPTDAEKL